MSRCCVIESAAAASGSHCCMRDKLEVIVTRVIRAVRCCAMLFE